MIKCYQCGWSNPDGNVTCQKCGQPVVGRMTPNSLTVVAHPLSHTLCELCGYAKSSLLDFCPWCGDGKCVDEQQCEIKSPYLERTGDGTSEIIELEDSQEVILNGIRYIFHDKPSYLSSCKAE